MLSQLRTLHGKKVGNAVPVVVVDVGDESVRVSQCEHVVSVEDGDGPSDARVSFRDDATAQRVASGALSPQRALATGALRVAGDVTALKSLFEKLEPVSVDTERRSDGEILYGVSGFGARRERSLSDFAALRKTLKAKPLPGGLACVGDKRLALDRWLKIAWASAREDGKATIRNFCGFRPVEPNELETVKGQIKDLEVLASRIVASVVFHGSRCVVFVSCAPLACLVVYSRAWIFTIVVAVALSQHALEHALRTLCLGACFGLWKLAKTTDDKTLLARDRPLGERLALRVVGEVILRIALAERGLLVKLGQFAASMSGLVAPEITEPLTSLTDSMPEMPERSLRQRIKDIPEIRRLDGPAVASASIAQVHKLDVDGDAWAVKVQRPHLKRRFRVELRSARMLAWLAVKLEPTAPDLRPMFDEAYKLHVAELDFRAEARALDKARTVVHTRRLDAEVPAPVLTADGVLCMRWCRGSKVDRVSDKGATLADGTVLSLGDVERLAWNLLDAFAAILLVGGLVNMDPHQGNILADHVTPVLLDWGMHEYLSDKVRLGFAKVIVAVAEENMSLLAESLLDLGVRSTFTTADSLMHLKFIFRASSPSVHQDRDAVHTFISEHEDQLEAAKSRAKDDKSRVVVGGEVFNSLIRQVDLLHGYVATLPVHVAFLDAYLKWSRVALAEGMPTR